MTQVPPNIESVSLYPSIGDLCENAFRRSACCHGGDPKAVLSEYTFSVDEADMFVNGSLMPSDCLDMINIVPVCGSRSGDIQYWIIRRQDEGFYVTAHKHGQHCDLLLQMDKLRFHFNLEYSTTFPRRPRR